MQVQPICEPFHGLATNVSVEDPLLYIGIDGNFPEREANVYLQMVPL